MISFQCECGKTHSASDEHAGKRGKCNACGNTLRIPGSRPATAQTAPPAKKPASPVMSPTPPPKARASSALDDQDLSHLYDLDDQPVSRPSPTPRGRPCPHCANPLPSPGATFCVDCGFNLKTGKVSKVEVTKPIKPKKQKSSNVGKFFESRLTSSKFVGGLLSLIGGSVWLALGLMANRIFFYPIFLIIGGAIGVLSGLISGDE